MLQMFDKAITDFTKVIELHPKNAHAFFRRAFAYKALKQFKEAADDFERAKDLDPLNEKLVVNYKQMKNVNCIEICKPG